MKRLSYKPYGWLAFCLFCLLSFSPKTSDRLRSASMGTIAPIWRMIAAIPGFFSSEQARQIDILKQENQSLKAELEMLKQYVIAEGWLQDQQEKVKSFTERRKSEFLERLELMGSGVLAKVIFREPASWSSTLWINVGERSNERLGKSVILKNSPVVVGDQVVGVIEYVGHRRSKVRLITDSGLPIAVRAQRDQKFLAKGEIFGVSQPWWRSRGVTLKGVGFNYDFADAEGEARSLRTGELLTEVGPGVGQGDKVPLIQKGDLLVTSGMDGVFPPGLRVAYVQNLALLKEGACSYEIEAKASISSLDNLSYVTVLPPID
ncbi:MAG: hypothetical protein JSR58_01400 [Verrucomicrobia bacterium]|nr:hypothetical protein [Verrucomicrobiota bacterium]